MPWEAWFLIAFNALSMIGAVMLIGEPRKPLTRGGALVHIAIAAFTLGLVLSLAGR